MTSRDDVRAEIRQFLTTRRARLTPAQAGLPAYGGNRRVPGLRRAEVRSQEFRVRWAAHDVGYYRSGVQPFHHPLVGDLTLDYDVLELTADPGQAIVAYSAESGSPSQQALDVLASWTSIPDQEPVVSADRVT